jgi:hypothetical protein
LELSPYRWRWTFKWIVPYAPKRWVDWMFGRRMGTEMVSAFLAKAKTA